MFENNLFAQQGWVCPKCGRVYSPATPMCFTCGNHTITTSTETTVGDIPSKMTGTTKSDTKGTIYYPQVDGITPTVIKGE